MKQYFWLVIADCFIQFSTIISWMKTDVRTISKVIQLISITVQVKLIEKSGYPAERHSVTTDDGYVLELQRIANPGGCPVLLQHGFSTSSAQWVLGRSDRALAYLLADCGYDVWLGNSRGNTYGRRHLSLDPAKGAFWEFSYVSCPTLTFSLST